MERRDARFSGPRHFRPCAGTLRPTGRVEGERRSRCQGAVCEGSRGFSMKGMVCLAAGGLLLPAGAEGAEPACTPDAKDDGHGGYLSLAVENDIVGGTDSDYTTGTYLSYLSDEVDCTHFARS